MFIVEGTACERARGGAPISSEIPRISADSEAERLKVFSDRNFFFLACYRAGGRAASYGGPTSLEPVLPLGYNFAFSWAKLFLFPQP
jgi:hypothetical protein